MCADERSGEGVGRDLVSSACDSDFAGEPSSPNAPVPQSDSSLPGFPDAYSQSLRRNDLVAQFELLRQAEKSRVKSATVESIEESRAANAPQIAIDFDRLARRLESRSVPIRFVRASIQAVQDHESVVRGFVSLWPVVAALLLSGIGVTLLLGELSIAAKGQLFAAWLTVFSSLVILCATRIWKSIPTESSRIVGPLVAALSAAGVAALVFVPIFPISPVLFQPTVQMFSGVSDPDHSQSFTLRLPDRRRQYLLCIRPEREAAALSVQIQGPDGSVKQSMSGTGSLCMNIPVEAAKTVEIALEQREEDGVERVGWLASVYDASNAPSVLGDESPHKTSLFDKLFRRPTEHHAHH